MSKLGSSASDNGGQNWVHCCRQQPRIRYKWTVNITSKEHPNPLPPFYILSPHTLVDCWVCSPPFHHQCFRRCCRNIYFQRPTLPLEVSWKSGVPKLWRTRLHFSSGILRNPVIPFFQAFGEELWFHSGRKAPRSTARKPGCMVLCICRNLRRI